MGSPAFLLSLFVSIEWLQGMVLPQILSFCWGWVAEGNSACKLWQCLELCLCRSLNKKLSCIPVLSAFVCVCGLDKDYEMAGLK